MSDIKRTYVLQYSSGEMICDEFGEPREFKSERAALKLAKERLAESTSPEIWVFGLTHVVSRPPLAPVVDVISWPLFPSHVINTGHQDNGRASAEPHPED